VRRCEVRIQDHFAEILQIRVKDEKLVSVDFDDRKAIIFRRADDLKDLAGLDSDCGMMVVSERKAQNRALDTISGFAICGGRHRYHLRLTPRFDGIQFASVPTGAFHLTLFHDWTSKLSRP